MKKCFLIAVMAMLSISVFAQEIEYQTVVNQKKTSTYTRGKGFFIRPEAQGGFVKGGYYVNGGYQFNPYVQASVGIGLTAMAITSRRAQLGFGIYGGTRVYTGKSKWAGMFDYHMGISSIKGTWIFENSLIGGASYKDFDFGAGAVLLKAPNTVTFGMLFALGWNIRLYKHR